MSWIELFREAGYDPIAPPWPGERSTVDDTRAYPDGMAGQGIGELIEHHAALIRALPGKPIVVGHSFGGLFAQSLLGRDLAAAAVAIDPAPIKGVLALPLSSLLVASAALLHPATNRKRTVALTAAQFSYGFGNALASDESADLHARWAIPSPGRPLFQAAAANLTPDSPAQVDVGNATRGPLLLIAGEDDHTAPPAITRATLALYRRSSAVTDLKQMPGRGHSLTIDSGWREVADVVLAWLQQRGV